MTDAERPKEIRCGTVSATAQSSHDPLAAIQAVDSIPGRLSGLVVTARHMVHYTGPLRWVTVAFNSWSGSTTGRIKVKTVTELGTVPKLVAYHARCDCGWRSADGEPRTYGTAQRQARAHMIATFDEVPRYPCPVAAASGLDDRTYTQVELTQHLTQGHFPPVKEAPTDG